MLNGLYDNPRNLMLGCSENLVRRRSYLMIHMIADSQGTATANAARRTTVRHLLRASASFGFIPGCPARTRAGKRSKGKRESIAV